MGKYEQKYSLFDVFRDASVLKLWPANAGDVGSIPGPGRPHVPWGT